MKNTDPKIDAYIEKSADFAKPVLTHLRKLVHKACPEVQETVKWGMPSFDYKGPFCSMAAFKQHAVFGFWKPKLINDPNNYLGENKAHGGAAMGNLGRITSLKDLPPDKVLIDFIKQAKKLNDEGIKIEKPKVIQRGKDEIAVPDYFLKELKKDKQALAIFKEFSYSKKKDYIEWITEAKTEVTREKRMATAIEWIAEGKSRHWKYEKKS